MLINPSTNSVIQILAQNTSSDIIRICTQQIVPFSSFSFCSFCCFYHFVPSVPVVSMHSDFEGIHILLFCPPFYRLLSSFEAVPIEQPQCETLHCWNPFEIGPNRTISIHSTMSNIAVLPSSSRNEDITQRMTRYLLRSGHCPQ